MNGTKILLIEDNLVEARGLTRILEHGGYTVVHAEDAREAMHRLRSEHPNLVILDVGLPVKDAFAGPSWDGLDFLKWMQSMLNDPIPVILQTGLGLEQVRRRLGESPLAAFFQKPAPLDQLLSAIQSALGEDHAPAVPEACAH